MELQIENHDSVIEILKEWHSLSKDSYSIPDTERQRLSIFFENLGFKNIVVHPNGRVDADKNGERFLGMYLLSMGSEYTNGNLIFSQEVTFDMVIK